MKKRRYTYSDLSEHRRCPFKWFLKRKLRKKPDKFKGHNNPMVTGKLVHGLIEGDKKTVDKYKKNYKKVENKHEKEITKAEILSERVKDMIPQGGQHEVRLKNDEFMGTLDYLVDNEIYEFKYSNSPQQYKEGWQVNLYAYYVEEILGIYVDKMYHVYIPRVKTVEEAKTAKITIEEIPFNENIVNDFFDKIDEMESATYHRKNKGPQCRWCEYRKTCERSNNNGCI